ncbi:MAG: CYTH domain-containing protein [Candidatus Tectomicrobia bacterium]|nr:CYTH domain-containing protein [Candidatus Tectomicrobia bacterium]
MIRRFVEIERKFLVERLPENLETFPREEILQGYIAITDDGTEVRIRKKGDSCFLAMKNGGSKTRIEEEFDISEERFDSLWPMTEGKRVKKVRYEIVHEGVTIEVDVYKEKLQGLVTAEAEFPSEEVSDQFHPPAWLGREVTEDKRYKNQNLARYGIPQTENH